MTETVQVKNRGWTVAAAGTGVNLVLGVLYAWSVIKAELVTNKDWGWSNFDANLPFATSTAAFALTMIFAGRIQDRIGPKIVAAVGGLLLGLGMITASFTHSPLMMCLTFGVLGGMGIGIGYSATTPPALKWFPATKKGLISGIIVAGVGLAAVYMSPVTQMMLGKYGIPNTLLILGIATIIVIALMAQFLTNPPAGYKPAVAAPTPGKKAPISRRDVDWQEMLTTPQFYGLWLMYILSAAPGLMLLANAKSIAKDQATWAGGVTLVMVMSIFNTVGRVVAGYVSDRIGRRTTMVLAFLLQAVNMYLFSHYNTPTLLMVGIGAAGLFYGSFFALMPATTADFYGLKNMGVNYGLIFTGFGVAGVVGSLLGGKVRDVLGSYDRAYWIFAGMLVVSAILAYVTRAPKVESEPSEATKAPEMAGTK